jgi:hypothetical protein
MENSTQGIIIKNANNNNNKDDTKETTAGDKE